MRQQTLGAYFWKSRCGKVIHFYFLFALDIWFAPTFNSIGVGLILLRVIILNYEWYRDINSWFVLRLSVVWFSEPAVNGAGEYLFSWLWYVTNIVDDDYCASTIWATGGRWLDYIACFINFTSSAVTSTSTAGGKLAARVIKMCIVTNPTKALANGSHIE